MSIHDKLRQLKFILDGQFYQLVSDLFDDLDKMNIMYPLIKCKTSSKIKLEWPSKILIIDEKIMFNHDWNEYIKEIKKIPYKRSYPINIPLSTR